MTVCIVGTGGREHALAHVLSRSDDVIVTPGSPAMAATPSSGRRIDVTAAPPEEIAADLFVIGPEVPLVSGLADRLRALGNTVFGPSALGAQLEGSKAFMKELAQAARVPTARYCAVDRIDDAVDFLRSLPGPYVVKTDGLAAGKGVFVTASIDEAIADAKAKLSGASFGDAGRKLVIEEGLCGPELSLLVLCDGTNIVALPPARDYKRIGDGDTGANTGGMGAFSSAEVADEKTVEKIMDEIVAPTLFELRRREIDYRGVLYAGCMLTETGPKLIEYNVRFGDPEAEVVLLRLTGDVVGLLSSVGEGRMTETPRLSNDAAVCVVLASAGYPASSRHGDRIEGIEDAQSIDGVTVFHAGTDQRDDGSFETNGGRVLVVSATAEDLRAARDRAYEGVDRISFDGVQFRHDIAQLNDHNEDMSFLPADRARPEKARTP